MRKPNGKIKNEKAARRLRRRLSIRQKVEGTTERPRVCAFRSNKHLTVQVIDDATGKTLLSVQTYGKNAVSGARANKEGAKLVGAKVAEELKAKKLENVVFDRAGYKYTGVIAALVETVRESGIRV
ncbi:MAG: 50S ribosomal protein L18 [Bacteriovoracaceae bacterium]|jgi:large subunit ribosomal protein L18|nr:50S ribosomal protein L18 [Bacteriovoracaceae bacterium]